MIYAYIRETPNQEATKTKRQKIERYAAHHHLKVADWVIEPTVAKGQRVLPKLQALAGNLREGDIILSSSIVDLGVSIHSFLDFLNDCFAAKGSIQTIEDAYSLHYNDTTNSFFDGIDLALQLTRQFTSRRTIEAMQDRKQQGVRLGRPTGMAGSPAQQRLLNNIDQIRTYISEGLTRAEIAHRLNVGNTTLYQFLKENSQLLTPHSSLLTKQ